MKRIFFLLLLALTVSCPAIMAGTIPGNADPAGQSSQEENILSVCRWLVDTPLSNEPAQQVLRKDASAEVLKYATTTDKFSINMGKAMANLLDLSKGGNESTDLLMVYIAGEIIYCLDNNLKETNADSFAAAMDGVVNIYAQMPKHSIKPLNKYLKMDGDKRRDALRSYYKSVK